MNFMQIVAAGLVITTSACSAVAGTCNVITENPEGYFSEVDPQQFYDCLAGNPNILMYRSASGQTLTHLAARYATEPFVPLFLAEFDLLPNEYDDDGNTPLHLAASREDYVPIIATLLAIGADKEATNLKGQRAYDLNDKAYPDIQVLLLPDDEDDALLLATIDEIGNETECESFLTPEFFRNKSPSNIFFCANRSLPTASNQEGNTALHLAAQHAKDLFSLDAVLLSLNRLEDIETALKARNLAGQTPLHLSARYSDVPGMSASLIVWGAEVDALAKPQKSWDKLRSFGTSSLHFAAYRRDEYQYFAVEELLAMGADVLLQDRKRHRSNTDREIGRQTALHYAVLNKNEAGDTDMLTVQLLLEAEFAQSSVLNPVDFALGWEANEIEDTEGQTALHYAAISDAEPQIINTLLDYKFSPTTLDKNNQSPLLLYAKRGSDPNVMLGLLKLAMMPGKTNALLGLRMQERAVCKTDNNGLSAMAYIRRNQKLNGIDPSGASVTPLSQITSICSN